jgi:hypothetical protein
MRYNNLIDWKYFLLVNEVVDFTSSTGRDPCGTTLWDQIKCERENVL